MTLTGKLKACAGAASGDGHGPGCTAGSAGSDLDTWMDAAHRGAAAAPAVQLRRDATSASAGAAAAAPSKVQLTIEWRGKFGADLRRRLRVQGAQRQARTHG